MWVGFSFRITSSSVFVKPIIAEVFKPAEVNRGLLLNAKCARYIKANASRRNSFFIYTVMKRDVNMRCNSIKVNNLLLTYPLVYNDSVSNMLPAETIRYMIIYHPRSLHVGIANSGAKKFEASFFHVF